MQWISLWVERVIPGETVPPGMGETVPLAWVKRSPLPIVKNIVLIL